MKTIYIAGPMTGHEDLNYPAFNQAEQELTGAGHRVLNPARQDLGPEASWLDYMRLAVRDVSRADGVCLLPGWSESRGANVEYDLATGLGLPCHDLTTWKEANK